MATKKEHAELLKNNLSTVHHAYTEAMQDLHSKLIQKAVNCTEDGEELSLKAVNVKVIYKENEKKKTSKEPTDKTIEALDLILETIKTKEPTKKSLDDLIEALDSMLKP